MTLQSQFVLLSHVTESSPWFIERDEHGVIDLSRYKPERMIYHTVEEAHKAMNDIVEESKIVKVAEDGTKMPTALIQRILGMFLGRPNNTETTVRLSILEYQPVYVGNTTISGRIQKPTGYTYD